MSSEEPPRKVHERFPTNVEKGRDVNMSEEAQSCMPMLHENVSEVEWRYWNYIGRQVLNHAQSEQQCSLICEGTC